MIPRIHHRRRSGAMLIITVLVIGAVALSVVVSGALRGLGDMGMGTSEARATEALAIADACMEEAQLRLALNSAYTGGSISMGNGTCTITVTTNGSLARIGVTAVRDQWTKRIMAVVDTSGARQTMVWWKQEL